MSVRKRLAALALLFLVPLYATTAYTAEWEKFQKEFDRCLGSEKRITDKSAAAAYYGCRRPIQECVSYLERPSFWYSASPRFRDGIDWELLTPPEALKSGVYSCNKTVPATLFNSLGTLTVRGVPVDAAVDINGVFAGRLPLEKFEMPPGEYLISLRSPQGEARGKITVKAGEAAEISLDAESGEEEGETSSGSVRTPVTRWWRTTDGEKVRKLWAAEKGVAVMLSDARTFRLFDDETGFQLWETVVSLAAASDPQQAGETLFWVSGTGMLNRLDLSTGGTEMLGKAGNGQDCRIAADDERVYAAGPTGNGGVVKAFSLRKGTEAWSLDLPEVPRKLVAAGSVLILLTEDDAVGSGTITSIESDKGRVVWDRFVADAERAVLAVDAGKAFLWGGEKDENGIFFDPADEGSGVPLIIESGARPAAARLADGHFFLITSDERVYAYDPAAGRLLWEKALGKGGARASILGITREVVTLLVNESLSGSRKGDVQGYLMILSRKTGNGLFSREVKLGQQPFFAGEDLMVVPDQLGTALARDLERDCIAWQFRSTAPGMIRGNVTVAGGENRIYLAAQLKGKLFAFTPGECLPALSLPDLPALEKPKPKPKKEEKKEERFVRKMPTERSVDEKAATVVRKRKPRRSLPARGNVGRKLPEKEEDYDPPPPPPVSTGLIANLPPLKKIPRSEMVGKVTQQDLLERIAMWCAERLDEWVVPETDGMDPMGYPADPFVEAYRLRKPLEYTLSSQGRYNFVFDKTGGRGGKAGFGFHIVDPVFVSLPGDRRAVSFGIRTDKGFVAFWDSIARAEIADDGTDVVRVGIRLFFPYARRGSFKEITREDLNGDGDPETIVRYVRDSGGAPKEGQVELYYILGGKRIFFQTEGSRIISRDKELVRETAVVYFEDRDGDGIKEVIMDRFSSPCCEEGAWPEKVTEKPQVYRLVNNVYTTVP